MDSTDIKKRSEREIIAAISLGMEERQNIS
jgi:hypothetical protein